MLEVPEKFVYTKKKNGVNRKMINNINKFGVKQRCMEGGQKLMDLLLTALHFERDMNFYI